MVYEDVINSRDMTYVLLRHGLCRHRRLIKQSVVGFDACALTFSPAKNSVPPPK